MLGLRSRGPGRKTSTMLQIMLSTTRNVMTHSRVWARCLLRGRLKACLPNLAVFAYFQPLQGRLSVRIYCQSILQPRTSILTIIQVDIR